MGKIIQQMMLDFYSLFLQIQYCRGSQPFSALGALLNITKIGGTLIYKKYRIELHFTFQTSPRKVNIA